MDIHNYLYIAFEYRWLQACATSSDMSSTVSLCAVADAVSQQLPVSGSPQNHEAHADLFTGANTLSSCHCWACQTYMTCMTVRILHPHAGALPVHVEVRIWCSAS